MAFLEHRFEGDPTNWWAPNHAAVEAMLRSAGMRVTGRPAHEIYLCEPDPATPSCVTTWNAAELKSATGQTVEGVMTQAASTNDPARRPIKPACRRFCTATSTRCWRSAAAKSRREASAIASPTPSPASPAACGASGRTPFSSAAWILVNAAAVPGIRPFDPFPFVMLAVITSVEAIFLSTFILITQNRMSRMAERRAEMDLQISLLTEHELTRALRRSLNRWRPVWTLPRPPEHEMAEIRSDINPQRVAEEIERVSGGAS